MRPAGGDYVRLRVIDNGVGIPPEARAHLFEPFFTTKDVGKGTGLGLASVYGIVRQSNGFITVESEPGRGSVFTMHFPVGERRRPRREPAHADLRQPARQRNDAARRGRRRGARDHQRDAAPPGLSACSRRRRRARACEMFAQRSDEIDLLLTDVVMPEMNGPALAQRLVALRPELRVLFISGYADMADAARVR